MRNLMSRHEYNAYRNQVNDQIGPSKRNFIQRLSYNIKTDVKKTLSTINNVLRGTSRKNKLVIKSIGFNNIAYNYEQSIPRIFNKYFTSIAEKN